MIALMRGMFQEQEKRFDQKLDDVKENLRDEMRSCISASEARIKTEIIDGITNILDESILPQISDLRTDVDRIKVRLQLA